MESQENPGSDILDYLAECEKLGCPMNAFGFSDHKSVMKDNHAGNFPIKYVINWRVKSDFISFIFKSIERSWKSKSCVFTWEILSDIVYALFLDSDV
jgi:hypothetical protein